MTIGELVQAIARLKELEAKDATNEGLDSIEFHEMLKIRDTVIVTEGE